MAVYDKNTYAATFDRHETEINHIIIPSKCEEIINKDDLPYQVVESLSYQKAYDVYKDNQSSLVIGADTIVVVDDIILGKPIDKEDAINASDNPTELFQMFRGIYHGLEDPNNKDLI